MLAKSIWLSNERGSKGRGRGGKAKLKIFSSISQLSSQRSHFFLPWRGINWERGDRETGSLILMEFSLYGNRRKEIPPQ